MQRDIPLLVTQNIYALDYTKQNLSTPSLPDDLIKFSIKPNNDSRSVTARPPSPRGERRNARNVSPFRSIIRTL